MKREPGTIVILEGIGFIHHVLGSSWAAGVCIILCAVSFVILTLL